MYEEFIMPTITIILAPILGYVGARVGIKHGFFDILNDKNGLEGAAMLGAAVMQGAMTQLKLGPIGNKAGYMKIGPFKIPQETINGIIAVIIGKYAPNLGQLAQGLNSPPAE